MPPRAGKSYGVRGGGPAAAAWTGAGEGRRLDGEVVSGSGGRRGLGAGPQRLIVYRASKDFSKNISFVMEIITAIFLIPVIIAESGKITAIRKKCLTFDYFDLYIKLWRGISSIACSNGARCSVQSSSYLG